MKLAILICLLAFSAQESQTSFLNELNGVVSNLESISIDASANGKLDIIDYPYQVSIHYSFYGHICGGAILSERWIVTVARCVWEKSSDKFTIMAGATALDDTSNRTLARAERIVIHPEYAGSRLPDKDIALIQLTETLPFSDSIKAIPIPNQDLLLGNGTLCRMAGWGAGEHLGDISLDLRLIRFATVAFETCETLTQLVINLPEDAMCAITTDLTGKNVPCTGEWGSPLTRLTLQGQQLIGLVSNDPLACAFSNIHFGNLTVSLLSMFTRVSSFSDWITSTIQEPELIS